MTDETPDILLFRPGALGDTILTIDAIRYLQGRMPGARVEIVGNPDGGRVLVAWDVVDAVTSFDSPDVTALFRHPPRIAPRWASARLAIFWLKTCDVANAIARATSASVYCVPPEPSQGSTVHVADHLLSTVRRVMGDAETHDLSVDVRPDLWRSTAEPLALLHPGSGSPRKNWPAEHFAQLAERLLRAGWSPRLLAGPADEQAVRTVIAHLEAAGISLPVLHPPGIVHLLALLESAALFVGNDSGVAHVSARLGTPTVVAFGATDPRRWAPRGPRARVVGELGAWPAVEEVWRQAVALTC